MKKFVIALTLLIACAAAASAQEQRSRTNAGASSASSVSKRDSTLNIQSGTRLAAQLENTLDARKARVGDRVVLRTTEAIKENGRTIVGKGARLIGHVTEVRQSARGSAQSSIGLVFDRLEKGSLELPITASITSITQAATRARAGDDDLFAADAIARSSTSTRGGAQRGSGGGLLGGVGNTVGGVVETTTQTTGSVVGGTTEAVGSTVGNTTNAVGRTVSGIQISQSSSASAEGGSTLSLSGGNLRLEKNTTFHLALSQSASVGNQ
ncbi:MAG TPA: hypothetical protein VGB17_05930 [Pyrinomonadaceae bacterium]|jgi:hypothetical protein